jgi:2-iminobutanoate/2-iminopropanoate deaminase
MTGGWLAIKRSVLFVCAVLSFTSVNAEVQKFEASGSLRDMPFSEAVRAGNLLFISGQVGTDFTGNLVPGGIRQESRQVLSNLRDAVYRRGLSMSDVVKCTAFLADISDWATFNEIYTTYFSKPYPARSALGANGLALNAAVELECIAAYPQRPNALGPTND